MHCRSPLRTGFACTTAEETPWPLHCSAAVKASPPVGGWEYDYRAQSSGLRAPDNTRAARAKVGDGARADGRLPCASGTYNTYTVVRRGGRYVGPVCRVSTEVHWAREARRARAIVGGSLKRVAARVALRTQVRDSTLQALICGCEREGRQENQHMCTVELCCCWFGVSLLVRCGARIYAASSSACCRMDLRYCACCSIHLEELFRGRGAFSQ